MEFFAPLPLTQQGRYWDKKHTLLELQALLARVYQTSRTPFFVLGNVLIIT